jgi:hypothetical protein
MGSQKPLNLGAAAAGACANEAVVASINRAAVSQEAGMDMRGSPLYEEQVTAGVKVLRVCILGRHKTNNFRHFPGDRIRRNHAEGHERRALA